MTEMTLSEKRSLAGQRGGLAKKGKKSLKVLEREEAYKLYRERVANNIESLLNAQLTLALGSSYLYKKDEGGKRVLVTNEAEICAFLNGDCDESEYDYVTAKVPNREAIKDLLDRTFGRPTESLQVASFTGFSLRDLHEQTKDLDQ